MNKTKKLISILLALILSLSVLTTGVYASDGKWIASWGTSPVDFYISLADYLSGFFVNGKIPAGTLIRTELKVTASGEKLRLKFSNEYGDKDVSFSKAFVARTDDKQNGAVKTKDMYPLSFGGKTTAVIPAGGTIWSDPIDMETQALEKITVSMYFSQETPIKTCGLFCGESYMSVALPSAADSKYMATPSEITIATGTNSYHVIPFLNEIDTYTDDEDAYSAVFIGDSTLVNGMTNYLSTRLCDAGEDEIGIINEGIMGNRLFYKGHGLVGNLYGDALLDRYTRDALSITGCEIIIVKIGVNDILHPSSKSMGEYAPYVSAQEIIEGYIKLANEAHSAGKKIYFMEITPWNGYVRDILGNKDDIVWTSELQGMCDTCNEWIKNNDVADGYINSDCLADPNNPTAFRDQFTRDGIHFTELGALAFADCIDIEKIFGISNTRTAAEIFSVDPYQSSAESSTNKTLVKLRNVLVFCRQLLSSLRIEYQPLHDWLDKIIDSLPDGTQLVSNFTRK